MLLPGVQLPSASAKLDWFGDSYIFFIVVRYDAITR